MTDPVLFRDDLKVGTWVMSPKGRGQIYRIWTDAQKWPYTVELGDGKHDMFRAFELTIIKEPVSLSGAMVLDKMITEMEEQLAALKLARSALDGTL